MPITMSKGAEIGIVYHRRDRTKIGRKTDKNVSITRDVSGEGRSAGFAKDSGGQQLQRFRRREAANTRTRNISR